MQKAREQTEVPEGRQDNSPGQAERRPGLPDLNSPLLYSGLSRPRDNPE